MKNKINLGIRLFLFDRYSTGFRWPMARQLSTYRNELKDKIYYWDGSWHDIYIVQSSRADWKRWVDRMGRHDSIHRLAATDPTISRKNYRIL